MERDRAASPGFRLLRRGAHRPARPRAADTGMKRPAWIGRKERGSPLLIRFMVWLTLRLGWSVGYVLLFPITLYFFLFWPEVRSASRRFLARVLDHPVAARDVFRHMHQRRLGHDGAAVPALRASRSIPHRHRGPGSSDEDRRQRPGLPPVRGAFRQLRGAARIRPPVSGSREGADVSRQCRRVFALDGTARPQRCGKTSSRSVGPTQCCACATALARGEIVGILADRSAGPAEIGGRPVPGAARAVSDRSGYRRLDAGHAGHAVLRRPQRTAAL